MEFAAPPASASEVKARAHADISDLLAANTGWAFPYPPRATRCHVHVDGNCLATPVLVAPDGRRQLVIPGGGTIDLPSKHIVMNCAGITCVPFAVSSNHGGQSHRAEVDSIVYFQERRMLAKRKIEDVFIVETAKFFPFEDIVTNHCGETHIFRGCNQE